MIVPALPSTRRVAIIATVLLALHLGAPAAVAVAQRAAPPQRITVTSDGHALTVWARQAPRARGVVVLLHGRTWSALPDFDLAVPGEDLSVMRAFVRRGYTVYALDARGYGGTPRDASGWLTPNQAARDVAAVLRAVAARHPALPRPTLVGWSYGSMVAHLTLQQEPALASGVVLFGYPRDPDMRLASTGDTVTPPRAANTAANAASDFIIPGSITPAAVQAYVTAALQADPVRSDWRGLEEWNALSPERLTLPVLLLHGEKDPFTPVASQAKTFTRLGSPDRQWVILAGGDHAALLEATAPAFIAAITAFIERPPLRR
ncbi:MAG: alpha/beta fold hydrolase [Gemmatimonadaceae bacterium]|nr:alpha/beta fold hydrolase [Gemmatimonadaceae bacterium]